MIQSFNNMYSAVSKWLNNYPKDKPMAHELGPKDLVDFREMV